MRDLSLNNGFNTSSYYLSVPAPVYLTYSGLEQKNEKMKGGRKEEWEGGRTEKIKRMKRKVGRAKLYL